MEKRSTLSDAERRSMSSSLSGREIHSPLRREESLCSIYRRHSLFCTEKELAFLHLAMGHSLPCMGKGHSPLCTIKGSVSSTHGIGKLSRLYRQDIPSFVKRRDLPPRLIAEGHPYTPSSMLRTHSLLCIKRGEGHSLLCV